MDIDCLEFTANDHLSTSAAELRRSEVPVHVLLTLFWLWNTSNYTEDATCV